MECKEGQGLFRVGTLYIYVQYLVDDPEYDIDYTIFDSEFTDVDGGVLDGNGKWGLRRAAEEIVKMCPEFFKPDDKIVQVDPEQYSSKLQSYCYWPTILPRNLTNYIQV